MEELQLLTSFVILIKFELLQVAITIITLISTLLGLSSLGFVVALELIGLVLNMFCTLIVLGHFLDLCSTLEDIIQGY